MNKENVTQGNRVQTAGERIMNVQFNPDQRPDVAYIKHWCAKAYDYIEDYFQKPAGGEGSGRLKAIAQTFLETFQMDAVKAVTFFAPIGKGDAADYSYPVPASRFGVLTSEAQPTKGQVACSVSFNVGGREDVAVIKSICSDIYDTIDSFMVESARIFNSKVQEFNSTAVVKDDMTEEERFNARNRPWPAELIIELSRLNTSEEAVRDALYALRHFQMYAVKAVTR